jgi:hypothetical protein
MLNNWEQRKTPPTPSDSRTASTILETRYISAAVLHGVRLL